MMMSETEYRQLLAQVAEMERHIVEETQALDELLEFVKEQMAADDLLAADWQTN